MHPTVLSHDYIWVADVIPPIMISNLGNGRMTAFSAARGRHAPPGPSHDNCGAELATAAGRSSKASALRV